MLDRDLGMRKSAVSRRSLGRMGFGGGLRDPVDQARGLGFSERGGLLDRSGTGSAGDQLGVRVPQPGLHAAQSLLP